VGDNLRVETVAYHIRIDNLGLESSIVRYLSRS
jgi:hypothetical protein